MTVTPFLKLPTAKASGCATTCPTMRSARTTLPLPWQILSATGRSAPSATARRVTILSASAHGIKSPRARRLLQRLLQRLPGRVPPRVPPRRRPPFPLRRRPSRPGRVPPQVPPRRRPPSPLRRRPPRPPLLAESSQPPWDTAGMMGGRILTRTRTTARTADPALHTPLTTAWRKPARSRIRSAPSWPSSTTPIANMVGTTPPETASLGATMQPPVQPCPDGFLACNCAGGSCAGSSNAECRPFNGPAYEGSMWSPSNPDGSPIFGAGEGNMYGACCAQRCAQHAPRCFRPKICIGALRPVNF